MALKSYYESALQYTACATTATGNRLLHCPVAVRRYAARRMRSRRPLRAGRVRRGIWIFPLCIVKLGCWGAVVQCNLGKRGWMGGIGGCLNVGGICILCTMAGLPDKFMPFMNQPPGSLLSSQTVRTYGGAIHALRRFTQASLNKEPSWRRRTKSSPSL